MEDITILFVDDEKNVLQSLERYLIKEPYNKLFVQSADQALEIFAKEPVHVVVTDMKMPEKDGLTMLRQIKADYPDTIRIVLSGFTEVAQIIPSINTGEIFRYVTKPLEPSEFKKTLNDAVEHYLLRRDKEELENKMVQTRYLTNNGLDLHLSASYGIATFPDDAKSLTKLLRRADMALFKTKESNIGTENH